MRKRVLRLTVLTAIAVLVAFGIHKTVVSAIGKLINVSVEFGSPVDEGEGRAAVAELSQQLDADEFADLPDPSPFREVEVFDHQADDWGNFFDSYAAVGALAFDANGDGRIDVYLTHNNNTWTRPTDERSVIMDEPRIHGNGLYLNLGNDEAGVPIFRRASELVRQNETFVEEELLIENFLFPRQSADETTRRVGRTSSCAIAVDVDGNGRRDLVVGSILPGMLWSHPKTQRVLGQFVRPVGRQAVNTKTPLSAQGLYFLADYVPGDQIDDVRESARGPEPEPFGANSLFLNLGDRDGDGLPEWRDASRESGIEGRRNTLSLNAADFDLDGDLDLFEANIMDMDYWPGGATALSGAANQIYVNQLAETGELKFVERSEEMGVDGLYDDEDPVPDYYRLYKIPFLAPEYSIALRRFVKYKPDFLEINGEKSEPGQISHAAVTQDVNGDGYMDIWVANDLGFLRLYVNEEGKRFRRSLDHPRARQTGYWMSFSPADFNGDLAEDLFAGNMGGASMNLAMPIPDLYQLFDPPMASGTAAQQFLGDSHHAMHSIYDGGAGFTAELDNKVRHSQVLPPDAALPNNIRSFPGLGVKEAPFDPDSLDPYEFAWGSTAIDVQNDGRQDLYWIGCLNGRGGGIFPIMGTGPGRLLVNATKTADEVRFVDLTAEHHVLNIQELRYDKLEDEGYIYRKSPLQNWGKRSMVYSYDVSVWGFQGPEIAERITNHDMIQTAENGRAAVAADLNGDGFADLIVRNIGGYDSRSSKATNLKAWVNGRAQVIPAHDANFPTPTNYEPGSTRVFLNTYRENHWIKIRLLDDSEGFNRDAIGARIVVNGKYVRVNRGGSGGFISNDCGPLHFGLGKDLVTTVEVEWPDRERTVTSYATESLRNGVLTISKTAGIAGWEAG